MPFTMEVIKVKSRLDSVTEQLLYCMVLQRVSRESNPLNSIMSALIYIKNTTEHATPEMPLD